MDNLKEISKTLIDLKSKNDIYNFLQELFTEAELNDLSKRWRILKLLNEGVTQREIAKILNVSLCKVTRGAKIIKNKDAIVTKYLRKEK